MFRPQVDTDALQVSPEQDNTRRIFVAFRSISMLIFWVTAVFSPYEGHDISPYFAFFLTNWSLTLMMILSAMACVNDDAYTHTQASVSAFLFIAWTLFLVPFDPHVLGTFRSYVSHLFPLLVNIPPFLPFQCFRVLSPPPQPRLHVMYGVSFYLVYIIWTILFDVFGLSCEGRDYIYKSLSWRHFPVFSTLLVFILLGLYTTIYFVARTILLSSAERLTSPRMATLSSESDEDNTVGVVKLRTSSS